MFDLGTPGHQMSRRLGLGEPVGGYSGNSAGFTTGIHILAITDKGRKTLQASQRTTARPNALVSSHAVFSVFLIAFFLRRINPWIRVLLISSCRPWAVIDRLWRGSSEVFRGALVFTG